MNNQMKSESPDAYILKLVDTENNTMKKIIMVNYVESSSVIRDILSFLKSSSVILTKSDFGERDESTGDRGDLGDFGDFPLRSLLGL